MNIKKKFEEYINEGIVKKRNPDTIRAKDLKEEAEKKINFLNEVKQKVPLSNDNANNFIEQAYNIILELVRAKMLIDGYKSAGQGAHEVEVSYLLDLGFSEADTEFMNEIRYSRNGMLYYGRKFDKTYAEKVLIFMSAIIPKLIKLLEKQHDPT